jgi:hypothetical protein
LILSTNFCTVTKIVPRVGSREKNDICDLVCTMKSYTRAILNSCFHRLPYLDYGSDDSENKRKKRVEATYWRNWVADDSRIPNIRVLSL